MGRAHRRMIKSGHSINLGYKFRRRSQNGRVCRARAPHRRSFAGRTSIRATSWSIALASPVIPAGKSGRAGRNLSLPARRIAGRQGSGAEYRLRDAGGSGKYADLLRSPGWRTAPIPSVNRLIAETKIHNRLAPPLARPSPVADYALGGPDTGYPRQEVSKLLGELNAVFGPASFPSPPVRPAPSSRGR